MEEEESSESEPGTILRQTPASGSTYDLSKATTITLTVAKKVTSVSMPNYIGSSLEFTKNNLTQIVGVKEANIEVVEVSTAPEGTAEGTVVSQTPRAGELVDLASTRIKLSIYKPKHHRQLHPLILPNVRTRVLLQVQTRGTNKEINKGTPSSSSSK